VKHEIVAITSINNVCHARIGKMTFFWSRSRSRGKQEFHRTDFGSRLLAAEGEGGGGSEGDGREDICG
jgi:hypothetical protein